MINNAVLYDIAEDYPLSYNNQVDSLVIPERMHPNHRYFIPFEPVALVNWDSRYYDYSKRLTPKSDAHPIYPIYGQWLIEHIYTKRSTELILQSLDNAKRLANMSLIDYDLQFIAQGLIYKKLNNIGLSDDEKDFMLNYVSLTNRIVQNMQHANSLKAQILLGQEPNLDEGWEKK